LLGRILTDDLLPSCNAEDFVVTAEIDSVVVTFDNVQFFDNCGDLNVSYSLIDSVQYSCGVYEVVASVTDQFDNTNSCAFTFEVEGCDGCCRSEELFIQTAADDFLLVSQFDLAGNCMVRLTPPTLDECQFITELDWGDGTFSQGMWGEGAFLDHLYGSPGIFELCVVYDELSQNSIGCYNFSLCQEYEVTSDCDLRRSSNTVLQSTLEIMPNPTNGVSNIRLANSEQRIKELSLYSYDGSLIESLLMDTDQYLMDLSTRVSGIYILKVTLSDGQILTSKIVKI